ncbi:hypothetical protein [Catellatospora bangladeshensis]|uniref:hypothetical protein n=1 Tax=Catellatospora bangladeshensis TaxID=310355 RepID=UPI001943C016|nr:hypothetical protein [Catellatospora bangladeshensis]
MVTKELVTCVGSVLERTTWVGHARRERQFRQYEPYAVAAGTTLAGLTIGDLDAAKVAGQWDQLDQPGICATVATVIACFAWPVTHSICNVGQEAIELVKARCVLRKEERDKLKDRARRRARDHVTVNGRELAAPGWIAQLLEPGSPQRAQWVDTVLAILVEKEIVLTAPIPPARAGRGRKETTLPIAYVVKRRDPDRFAVLATPEGRALLDKVFRSVARPLKVSGATADEVDQVLGRAVDEHTVYLLGLPDPHAELDPKKVTNRVRKLVWYRVLDARAAARYQRRTPRHSSGAEHPSSDDTAAAALIEARDTQDAIAAASASLATAGYWEAQAAAQLLRDLREVGGDSRTQSRWRSALAKKWDEDARQAAAGWPPLARHTSCEEAIEHIIELIRAALRSGSGGSA